MAEIKSTLELVLERTKHLSLSAEEKAEMHFQDILKRVSGYVERLLDRNLTPETFLDEIGAQPQEYHQRIRREAARQMSQALDLSAKTDPLVAALEGLTEPAWADLLAEVKHCRLEYGKLRDVASKQAQSRILARLAAGGIGGSAVLAKLEGDPSWQAEDRELRRSCDAKLTALQEALA